MTAKQLFEQTVKALFVNSDVPENLLGTVGDIPSYTISNGILAGFFIQGLYDAQRNIPCMAANNASVFDHCAGYFQCGMTVIPAPRGRITKIYVVDRINPDTGLEDADVDIEWCAKVVLSQVAHCHINRYAKLCERCGTTISEVSNVLASQLFGLYGPKHRYPRPATLAEINAARVEAGDAPLPPLPMGFHYPDDSTDVSYRSPSGVFSIERGRIYIAPWINSTESVVIEWSGIKRNWSDADLVDDDPKFAQFMRLHVGEQYERFYGDSAKANDYHDQLFGNPGRNMIGVLPELIHECQEEMRAATCGEAGVGGMSGAARGMGASSNIFYNERQEFTASCPTGQTGDPVTVVVEAGTVGSALSVADANAAALQQATDSATASLTCVTTFSSVAVIGHASCPGAQEDGTPAADGNAVSYPLPAGYSTSTVSQDAANAAAQAAADALAAEQLSCTYWNKEQTFTAECPEGQTGTPVEKTVAAHSFSGASQSLADSAALAEAERLALEELVCDDIPAPVYYNTTQFVGPFLKQCSKQVKAAVPGGNTICWFTVSVTIVVGAGQRTGATQQAANDAAVAYANQYWASISASPTWCNNYPCQDQSITLNI